MLSTLVVLPGVLCVVLGSTISEGCEGTRMCPEEGNKIGEMAGRNVSQGATEDHGFV